MTNSSAKGSRRERELVNELYDAGWAVVRIPSSGSATTRELPDVFAMRDHPSAPYESVAVAIEVKANAGEYCTLEDSEVRDLNAFAMRAGPACLAAVATRPNHDRWHFWPTVDLNERREGYSVTKAMYPGLALSDLLGYVDPIDDGDEDHRLAGGEPAEQPAPAPWDDPDVDDTPLAEQPRSVCPNCGNAGGLDGLGDVALGGTWMTQLHCPDCDVEFAVETEVTADV